MKVISILLLVAVAATASAQVEIAEARRFEPSLTSPFRPALPSIDFSISEDQKTAAAQIGGGSDDNRWAITVSGAVGSNKKMIRLATHEELSQGSSIEGLYRRTRITVPSPQDVGAICAQFRLVPGAANAGCTRGQLTDEGKRAFDRLFRDVGRSYGLTFKYGRTSFDYIDKISLADESVSHNGVSGSAFVGTFFDTRAIYYASVSIRHESAYGGQDPAEICSPISSGSSSLRCREAGFGAPTRKTKNLITLETRHFWGEDVALVPRLIYETRSKVGSIELPIYLRSSDNPFNGGFSAGWDTKNHKIIISLFIGALPKLP